MKRSVVQQIWNATIKIPELKTPLPIVPSLQDEHKVVDLLTKMFEQHKGSILVVTGAGISTDSGIPDYRGDEGTYVRNPNHRPILYHELSSSHHYRQRYWSRSYLGWPKMSQALPNDTHHILSQLSQDYIQTIITQNVDSLHTKANTPPHKLIELHGTLYKVECMTCGDTSIDRNLYQNRIHARNPSWKQLIGTGKMNPDGDVDLPKDISFDQFDIPACLSCGSKHMKPNVVFFGENIRKQVSLKAEESVTKASAVLVLGSSLATYSCFRLLRLAHQLNKPIAIITKGPTRADNLMDWKGQVGCRPVLKNLISNLIGP
ncbi:DHS-like NAD/FAD-binding domain-containing protein [Thamnidium elegans]|nr:DHS-like NAD/FAD-binding domain-containing protein [Thamnidium elegans]